MNRKANSSVHLKGFYSRQLERLEQHLQEKSREWRSLSEQNSSLRRREELLFKSISTLGENLHFTALAAALELNRDIANEPCSREIAECLAQDLQVYSLLHSVSTPDLSSVLAAESYTAHVLKDAITPERIAEIRMASQKTHMQVLGELTMRLAYHLGRHKQQQRIQEELAMQKQQRKHEEYKRIKKQLAEEEARSQKKKQKQQKQQPSQTSQSSQLAQGSNSNPPQPAAAASDLRGGVLSSSLESVIDEYFRYTMLVSMTNYKCMQRMCYYTLESLERATPPNGYWHDVMLEIGLRPSQMQQIRDAFERYSSKMAPLFARAQELGNEVRQVLRAVELASSDSTPGSSTSNSGDTRNASASWPQQQQQRDQEHSSHLQGRPSAVAAAACDVQLQQLQLQQPGESAEQPRPMDTDQYTPAASDGAHPDCMTRSPAEGASLAADKDRLGSAQGSSSKHTDQVPPAACRSSSTSSGSIKPWQEFGLATTGLGVEAADKLTALLSELEQNCNSMSQLSHGLTFPVVNMLDRLQLTKMVVASYPFLPNVCQISNVVYWEVTDSGASQQIPR